MFVSWFVLIIMYTFFCSETIFNAFIICSVTAYLVHIPYCVWSFPHYWTFEWFPRFYCCTSIWSAFPRDGFQSWHHWIKGMNIFHVKWPKLFSRKYALLLRRSSEQFYILCKLGLHLSTVSYGIFKAYLVLL